MNALSFQRILVVGFFAWAIVMLAGCSTAGALSGLIGSKPDVTAQVGAENVKQTVGLTAKQEQKNDTEIKNSNVGKVDTSTKKTESINAGTIQAERIEIRNGSDSAVMWFGGGMIAAWIVAAGLLWSISYRRQNKGA